ncbi:MAG: YidC/Oxa1 family membrane protein insertase [Christensenellaceae bacterium]|jgi:membrane protein insertase Oxa1/YidC/SpoIIIJ|nr:YidC/Oxa1 family membrane protein insertase [Christensenellaceae bacterium]
MLNLLNVSFPKGTGIEGLVYVVLDWLTSSGMAYILAVVLFTVMLKLVLLPLDFGNRYFTKKNQLFMQKIAPEEAELRKIFGNDPVAFNRAKQDLYRRNGGGQAGFCLFMLINLVLTLVVFLSVFSGLRAIGNYNTYEQTREIYAVYNGDYASDEEKNAAIIAKYDETTVSFLWVKNVWQPDTGASPVLTYKQFEAIEKTYLEEGVSEISEEDYNAMFAPILETKGASGWNGYFLLVALAGAVTFASIAINTKLNNAKSKNKVVAQEEAGYSIRKVREAADANAMPQVNPAMANNMMKVIMPIIMIFFTISSTSAMSVYIIANSVVGTLLTLGSGFIVDAMLARSAKKKEETVGDDTPKINPHAKYFKTTATKKK